METVTEISESQFFRKDYILTNVTDFLASGNQLLSVSQTTVSNSGKVYFKKSFIRLVETCFLIRVNFLLVEIIIGILGEHFSKKELNFASGQLIIWLVETVFFHFLR